MSESKIYVGNLPYSTDEAVLEGHFGKHGEIADIKIIMDRETGRSKGFGFITFADAESAKKALTEDGQEMDGRKLRVNIARENPNRGR